MSTNPRALKRWRKLIREGLIVVCALCDKRIEDVKDLTVDHIHPRSLGGKNHRNNLQPAHSLCNNTRGNTTMNTYQALKEMERSHDN